MTKWKQQLLRTMKCVSSIISEKKSTDRCFGLNLELCSRWFNKIWLIHCIINDFLCTVQRVRTVQSQVKQSEVACNHLLTQHVISVPAVWQRLFLVPRSTWSAERATFRTAGWIKDRGKRIVHFCSACKVFFIHTRDNFDSGVSKSVSFVFLSTTLLIQLMLLFLF